MLNFCNIFFLEKKKKTYNYDGNLAAVNFGEEADNIDFIGQNDQILGGALCKGIPVFFSVVHGLVSVLPSESSRLEFSNMYV